MKSWGAPFPFAHIFPHIFEPFLSRSSTTISRCRHPLELSLALLVEMHRTKDALKLLSSLLSRVLGPRQQHLFFGLARLYAKYGLNKDALVIKLPSLCNNPPDRRTWELLKSMAEVSPPIPLRPFSRCQHHHSYTSIMLLPASLK